MDFLGKTCGLSLLLVGTACLLVDGLVILPPPAVSHQEIRGSSIVFECVTSGSAAELDLASIHWSKSADETRQISMHLISVNALTIDQTGRFKVTKKTNVLPGQKGFDLEIPNVKVDDEGEYLCSVQSGGKTTTQKYTLEVKIPPSLQFTEDDLKPKIAMLGDSLTLECKIDGRPDPTITWRKLGSNLGNHTKTEGKNLSFPKLMKTDTGDYECKGENGAGSPQMETLKIIVEYAPDVDVKENIVYSGPRKTAILTCIVSASPAGTVEWDFQGERITNHRKTKENSMDLGAGIGKKAQLTINDVGQADFGEYTCRATNPHGSDQRTVSLSGLPKKVLIMSSKKGPYAELYKLKWMVTSHDLPLDYYLMFRQINGSEFGPWYNSSIPANADGSDVDHRASYTFKQLAPNTRYQVKLQARNSIGAGESSDLFEFVTAEAGSTPPPPTLPPKSTVANKEDGTRKGEVSDGQTSGATYLFGSLSIYFGLLFVIHV